MVPKTACVAVLLAAVVCSGCETLPEDFSASFENTYYESRPPSNPLPIWAEWSDIEKARLEDFYASNDSMTLVRNSYIEARKRAMDWAIPCIKPDTPEGVATEQDKIEMARFHTCAAWFTQYQNLGMMLSEMHCGAFLGALARAQDHQQFARETASELGTASSAIMGLFKNATGITSAVTTTFGLFENSFKNYEEAYLPGERVRNGLGVFQRARLELLANYQENPPASVAIAEYRINYYAASCSIDWIQRLIDASVSKANEDEGTSELVIRMGGVLPPKSTIAEGNR